MSRVLFILVLSNSVAFSFFFSVLKPPNKEASAVTKGPMQKLVNLRAIKHRLRWQPRGRFFFQICFIFIYIYIYIPI